MYYEIAIKTMRVSLTSVAIWRVFTRKGQKVIAVEPCVTFRLMAKLNKIKLAGHLCLKVLFLPAAFRMRERSGALPEHSAIELRLTWDNYISLSPPVISVHPLCLLLL